MINPKGVILLLVALGCAGGTAWFVDGLVGGRPATPAAAALPPPPAEETRILVAKKELATGTFLKSGDLDWQVWPEAGLNDGYVRENPNALKEFEGAVVRTRLTRGEPITKARVVHPGEKGFLAAVLDPGKRAVAVPVDGATGVGGFVLPGDEVDVILTIQREQAGEGGAEKRAFAETLLTQVRVLAIDQTADNTGGQAKVGKTATLEVTPKQAEKLALGLELGDLGLSLRSLQRNEVDGPRLDTLAADKAAAKAAPADKSYTRDTDVMSMIGDPWGLEPPSSVRRKVTVLRGSEDAKDIKY
ncbi:MAG: Flp pilus assembly protein CpaB [Rhodospirillales bacterium]